MMHGRYPHRAPETTGTSPFQPSDGLLGTSDPWTFEHGYSHECTVELASAIRHHARRMEGTR